MKTKTLFSIAAMFLPQPLKLWLLRIFCGFEISPGVRIGFSLVICEELVMKPRASIGSFCVIRRVGRVEMGERARIANFNWITSIPEKAFGLEKRNRMLALGDHTVITGRHYIDVQESVTIGHHTTIAGVKSTLLTHEINIGASRQECRPISIGNYCFIGTGCIILSGAVIEDCCVLAAGAVVPRGVYPGPALYGGVPAKRLKALDSNAAYFKRIEGHVS